MTPTIQSKPEALTEERSWDRPDFSFVPGFHNWKQQGYYLICYSCELTHAVWIGRDKMMVGVDDKGPILKTRKELGMA
jgi:hypothetical protein